MFIYNEHIIKVLLMAMTTIQINVETREMLGKFREYPRETYDEVLRKLMALSSKMFDEGELSDKTLEEIKISNEQFKNGSRTYSTRELLLELRDEKKRRNK